MPFDLKSISDPITTDPAVYDPDFPISGAVTHFYSQGGIVHASLSCAQGPELKPTVVLPPTAYGWHGMDSLITPLVYAGVNVLVFHPRGMWDGKSDYSVQSGTDDVLAAVEFLRTSDEVGKKTGLGQSYRVDPSRIGVIGLSGGGATSGFIAAAESEHVSFAISMAPANYELHRDLSILDMGKATFDFVKAESAGRIDVETRARNMSHEDMNRLSIIANAEKLVGKKLLLVGAVKDKATPYEHCHVPIAAALREAGAEHFSEATFDTDHSFSNVRIGLARLVIGWLKNESIL